MDEQPRLGDPTDMTEQVLAGGAGDNAAGAVGLGAVRAGDAVMIKGSLGSKMGPIVKALIRQFPSHGDREAAAAEG